jgi:hypothetical protein
MHKDIKNLYVNILKRKIKYGVIPSESSHLYLGTVIDNHWGMEEPIILKIYSELLWENENVKKSSKKKKLAL